MNRNQPISKLECQAIRNLSDFDMSMLISEVHEFGWLRARVLLRLIPDTKSMFHDLDRVEREASGETN